MDFYGGDVDLKAMLEMLKADDDPVMVHQFIVQLQMKLSQSEDKNLSDFPLNGYITRLLEILGHTIVMEFQVDTKCKFSTSQLFILVKRQAQLSND